MNDRQEAVYERLLELRDEGHIADVSVEAGSKQVRAATDTTPAAAAIARPARETYEEFEAWADRNGHTLEPAFSTHTLGSLVSDDCSEVIRFPMIALAVYDGDDLLAVAPCSTDGGVRTVDDCVAALESGALLPTPREESG